MGSHGKRVEIVMLFKLSKWRSPGRQKSM